MPKTKKKYYLLGAENMSLCIDFLDIDIDDEDFNGNYFEDEYTKKDLVDMGFRFLNDHPSDGSCIWSDSLKEKDSFAYDKISEILEYTLSEMMEDVESDFDISKINSIYDIYITKELEDNQYILVCRENNKYKVVNKKTIFKSFEQWFENNINYFKDIDALDFLQPHEDLDEHFETYKKTLSKMMGKSLFAFMLFHNKNDDYTYYTEAKKINGTLYFGCDDNGIFPIRSILNQVLKEETTYGCTLRVFTEQIVNSKNICEVYGYFLNKNEIIVLDSDKVVDVYSYDTKGQKLDLEENVVFCDLKGNKNGKIINID
jgi:hypothetical protein